MLPTLTRERNQKWPSQDLMSWKEKKKKQENDLSMWLSLVIIISRLKKLESLEVNWPSEWSCQNVGDVHSIIVQIMIGKLGCIRLDLKTYIKENGILPSHCFSSLHCLSLQIFWKWCYLFEVVWVDKELSHHKICSWKPRTKQKKW